MQSRYELAQSIMGNDFILPMDVVNSRDIGIKYENGSLVELGRSVPEEGPLMKYRRHDFILVPGPPIALNLLEIHSLFSKYFYAETKMWYSGERETFSRKDLVHPGWLAFRKQPIRASMNKKWLDQYTILPRHEVPANVAQTVWCLVLYELVRNLRLFLNVSVRTSSILSTFPTHQVTVSREFVHEGLIMIDAFNGSITKEDLGIASVL